MTTTARTDGSDLLAVARKVAANAVGGEQIDVTVGQHRSTTVRVHDGAVESFTSAEAVGVGVRVIVDGRQGFASAGSLADDVVGETLAEARDNARFGEPDEFNGLADPDGVVAVEHDQWNDALLSLRPDQCIETALELERRVLASDPRIVGVRTATWSDGAGQAAYAASNGLSWLERATSCSIGVQAIARDGDHTQVGAYGDAARAVDDLDLDRVVAETADRATRLLGATQPRTVTLPVVLEPRLAMTLLGLVAGTLDGESVQKGRSPFADRLGEQIASPALDLVDDPTDRRSIAATGWDGEGLACRRNPLIRGGRLDRFLHNSYTARKGSTSSTGSAVRGSRSLPGVGPQVLVMTPGNRTLEQIVADLDDALFVASFSGLHSGVNTVSGDFSVGADGLRIRGGAFAEPVKEVTLASTLQRLLLGVVEVGADLEWLVSGDGAAALLIGEVVMGGR
ncbi:MAG: TldD/PmbA family protein [Microthrixaceae bacterium]